MHTPIKAVIALVLGTLLTTPLTSLAQTAELVTGGYSREFQTMDMMKRLDADGNHQVSEQEFTQFHTAVFNALDRNHNDQLDSSEWTGTQSSKMASLGTGGYLHALGNLAMMDAADANHDHIVTKAEFLQFQSTVFVKLDRQADKQINPQEFVAKLVGR